MEISLTNNRQALQFFGYYGSQNIGDEAFRLVFNQLFPEYSCGYIAPQDFHEGQNFDSIVDGTATLIVGGGAVIAEPYFFNILPAGIEFRVLSAELGASEEHLQASAAKLAGAKSIALRNRSQIELVRRYTSKTTAIDYVPDFVFAADTKDWRATERADKSSSLHLALSRKAGLFQKKYGASGEAKNLAVFLSDHYTDSPRIWVNNVHEALTLHARHLLFESELARAFDELVQYYNIYFIPMSVWHGALDVMPAHSVRRLMLHGYKTNLILDYLSPSSFFDIIGCFDVCISMKYHGLIIPMTAGVPVVNIGSSTKNLALCSETGIPSVPYPAISAQEILKAVKLAETRENWVEVQRYRLEARAAVVNYVDNLKANGV